VNARRPAIASSTFVPGDPDQGSTVGIELRCSDGEIGWPRPAGLVSDFSDE